LPRAAQQPRRLRLSSSSTSKFFSLPPLVPARSVPTRRFFVLSFLLLLLLLLLLLFRAPDGIASPTRTRTARHFAATAIPYAIIGSGRGEVHSR
jgi:hypothetical protein